MSTPEPTPIDAKVEYEESGRVHRYFLNWRHAAFAGYFAILYGFASTAEKIWKEAPGVLPWLLLGAGFVGIGFLFIDLRTRELYYAAIEAGKAIESGEKGTLYARLQVKPRWWPNEWPGPHSAAIWAIYLLFSFALFAGAAAAWSRFCS